MIYEYSGVLVCWFLYTCSGYDVSCEHVLTFCFQKRQKISWAVQQEKYLLNYSLEQIPF